MRLLGRTQMLSQYPLLDSLAVIRQLGFDGAEICMERKDWSRMRLTPQLAADIRDRVSKLGLAPVSVSLHQDYIYDDGLFEETKQTIRLTRECGSNIFVFSGTARRSGDEDEWQRMVERTRALVDVACDCDVVLAQEFEPGFIVGSTADLLRLLAEIPSPHLAANLDLGHAFICDPDPLQSIRQLGDRIVHCHVENMPAGVHDHLLPHEGDMDLVSLLHELQDVSFDGGLALDLYKYDYEVVAPEAIRYLRALMI